MTRTERQFDQRRAIKVQKIRSRFRSRGRFERCSRTASCGRRTRFSAGNSAWLRRSDRRRTKIIRIQPMRHSQTLCPKMHERSYERPRPTERQFQMAEEAPETAVLVPRWGFQDPQWREVLLPRILSADFSSATVVTLYLCSESNRKLKPRLETLLPPGTFSCGDVQNRS